MLTLQQIKADPALIVERLAVKGFDAKEKIDELIALDDRRRALQFSSDNMAAELKKHAAAIGALMKEGKKDEADKAKALVAELKASQGAAAAELADVERCSREILLTIPNIPCAAVPHGKTAADNVVEKTGGPMPDLPEDALPHWDLAKKYNLIDFDLGVKITGAGFPVYVGKGARLQRALIQFSSTRPGKRAIWKSSPPMWSMKHRATVPASSPTRRVRCTTSMRTTSISSPPPKSL